MNVVPFPPRPAPAWHDNPQSAWLRHRLIRDGVTLAANPTLTSEVAVNRALRRIELHPDIDIHAAQWWSLRGLLRILRPSWAPEFDTSPGGIVIPLSG